jgi:hypothetical protein
MFWWYCPPIYVLPPFYYVPPPVICLPPPPPVIRVWCPPRWTDGGKNCKAVDNDPEPTSPENPDTPVDVDNGNGIAPYSDETGSEELEVVGSGFDGI